MPNYENDGTQNRHIIENSNGRRYAAMESKKNRNEKAYAEFKRVPMAVVGGKK